jgi:hypothetical protein
MLVRAKDRRATLDRASRSMAYPRRTRVLFWCVGIIGLPLSILLLVSTLEEPSALTLGAVACIAFTAMCLVAVVPGDVRWRLTLIGALFTIACALVFVVAAFFVDQLPEAGGGRRLTQGNAPFISVIGAIGALFFGACTAFAAWSFFPDPRRSA